MATVVLLTLAAGCNRDGVKVYKADSSDTAPPPPPPAATSTPGAMPAAMPPGVAAPDDASLPKLAYAAPDGWKEKPATQFRVASFDISENGKTAEVSVVPLGPASGTDTANVTRWRGQVGQPPADDAELQRLAEPVMVGDKPASLYDIAGTTSSDSGTQRILGVILHTDQATWYFKMMGDSELVEKNKPAFVAFLKSVQFQASQASAAPPAMDMSQLPASHPPIAETTATAPAAPADKPLWMVPSDWKEGELTEFLTARYIIHGNGDETAAVNVSRLDGDGGGLLANINRWRGQLGQPPITDDDAAKLPTMDASGAKGTIADFTGADARSGKPARLIGVILPLDGQTWFYKLMGDPDLVARQKDLFINFVQSAKYPAAR